MNQPVGSPGGEERAADGSWAEQLDWGRLDRRIGLGHGTFPCRP
jgi:hypothetical protein